MLSHWLAKGSPRAYGTHIACSSNNLGKFTEEEKEPEKRGYKRERDERMRWKRNGNMKRGLR